MSTVWLPTSGLLPPTLTVTNFVQLLHIVGQRIGRDFGMALLTAPTHRRGEVSAPCQFGGDEEKNVRVLEFLGLCWVRSQV